MNKNEALKMAIEYLECPTQGGQKLTVINACKEALEQPAQEPVAVIYQSNNGYPALRWDNKTTFNYDSIARKQPDIALYIHPHQWQELTDNEKLASIRKWSENNTMRGIELIGLCDAIEQALKEKNT